jgi:tetratricopeptide (TPR) repeat protein
LTRSHLTGLRPQRHQIVARHHLEDCNESLRLRANDAPTLDSRGFTCLKLGQLNHAISDYDGALGLDPNQAESYYGRGVAKLKKDDRRGGNADIAAAKVIQADRIGKCQKVMQRFPVGCVTSRLRCAVCRCTDMYSKRFGRPRLEIDFE